MRDSSQGLFQYQNAGLSSCSVQRSTRQCSSPDIQKEVTASSNRRLRRCGRNQNAPVPVRSRHLFEVTGKRFHTRAFSQILNVLTHLGRVGQFPEQRQQANYLTKRSASGTAVDDPCVFDSRCLKAQEIGIVRHNGSPRVAGEIQLPFVGCAE